jgi:hypothetical protein
MTGLSHWGQANEEIEGLGVVLGHEGSSHEELGGSLGVTHIGHSLNSCVTEHEVGQCRHIFASQILLVVIPEFNVIGGQGQVGLSIAGATVVADPDVVTGA